MITSEFYAKELPKYVNDFNALKYPENAMKTGFQTI